jgi:hypothetical protein
LPQPQPQPTGPLPSVATTGLSVEVLGPKQVGLNDVLPCELVVRNPGTQVLAGVRIELPLPAGLRLVAAEPMPDVQPERLVWDLGPVEVRGERRLRIDLLARSAEDLVLQPRANYHSAAYRPEVVRSAFVVEQLGPDVVPRGMAARLRLRVTNHSPQPLEKVVVTTRLPAGLFHPNGQVQTALVGQLVAGESRTVEQEVVAHRPGRWINEIVAEAEGGQKATTRAAVTVAEPNLSVRLLGPDRVSVGAEADWRLEIVNGRQGPAAHNLRVTMTLPEGVEPTQATTQARIDSLNRRIVWQLGGLEPGQQQTVLVKARCEAAGTWTTRAVVQADQLTTTLAEQTVQVAAGDGASRLGLGVQAAQDHLEVGDETVYEIRLSNLGSRPEEKIRLSAWVPEGMVPLRAEGPTDGRILQQQVQFAPVPSLEPRATYVYRLWARGQRPGTWRLRVETAAEGQSRPLIVECPILVQTVARAVRPSGNPGR